MRTSGSLRATLYGYCMDVLIIGWVLNAIAFLLCFNTPRDELKAIKTLFLTICLVPYVLTLMVIILSFEDKK